mmetsp:Transcript_8070/g.19080  ORF Transcript_8070/g.19080 Transcript_8070/m.19080 type:complete len:81 (-) Transcript_8070:229-471(-)
MISTGLLEQQSEFNPAWTAIASLIETIEWKLPSMDGFRRSTVGHECFFCTTPLPDSLPGKVYFASGKYAKMGVEMRVEFS